MTNTYTRGLAEYIASSSFEILPQAVVEEDATILVAMIASGSQGL